MKKNTLFILLIFFTCSCTKETLVDIRDAIRKITISSEEDVIASSSEDIVEPKQATTISPEGKSETDENPIQDDTTSIVTSEQNPENRLIGKNKIILYPLSDNNDDIVKCCKNKNTLKIDINIVLHSEKLIKDTTLVEDIKYHLVISYKEQKKEIEVSRMCKLLSDSTYSYFLKLEKNLDINAFFDKIKIDEKEELFFYIKDEKKYISNTEENSKRVAQKCEKNWREKIKDWFTRKKKK
ncbi:MAG: hypothetical protein COZ18_11425 [Flexibacter sp. CG_4_10_14_3_um_filter_32_15]|nr:MAG: hypothetical protein COZ18_11425 [Flexibacter sp. CG_4_10_14_3_um_filter_32_15]